MVLKHAIDFVSARMIIVLAANVLGAMFLLSAGSAQEVVVTMNDGRQYEGRLSGLSGYSPTPSELLVPGTGFPVVMIDDGLRRVFVNAYRRGDKEVPLEKSIEVFDVWQDPIFKSNKGLGVGPVLDQTRFDEFGRRVITLMSSRGSETYVQAIKEITPDYVKVVGLQTRGKNRYFDMRYATSSIPRDVIVKLLHRQIKDPDNSLERQRLVAFFTAAGMYVEADRELKAMQEKFPGLKKELDDYRKKLQLEIHRRALNEIRFRYEAGQAKLASEMWKAYPDKRVMPGEIAAEFIDLDEQMKNSRLQIEAVKQSVNLAIEAGKNSDDLEAAQKKILVELQTELLAQINASNVDRFSTYLRFSDDPTLTLSQKLAYAISGWFVGSAKAENNFAVAQTFPHTRRLIREYLTDSDPARRESILKELEQIETGTPEYIALIVANMTPVLPPTAAPEKGKPFRFTVEIAAPKNKLETIEYVVQLPPQYDPHRKYPCVVTLPTVGFKPEVQLQWWTGKYLPNLDIHSGPASRHGYIVISPKWWSDGQGEYQYSVREHDAVVASLRDSLRRFSIDTDRVFLSGHFKGGDAAWDIGLSHPDLWAGVIPISARPDKYVLHYYETAYRNVLPFYIVMGGKDFGVRSTTHTTTLDRWLRKSHIDCTLVEFQGRGGENFFEEIHNIFQWMKLKKRLWVPADYNGRSLRPTDNYFWNFEINSIPAKSNLPPILFDVLKRDKDTFKINVRQKAKNKFYVSPPRLGENVTFWLGPEFVDFSANVEIDGRGSDFNKSVTPSRRVILEDVRRRGDRQHPFWAKLFCAKSKWVIQE